jgi:hypothetical protein
MKSQFLTSKCYYFFKILTDQFHRAPFLSWASSIHSMPSRPTSLATMHSILRHWSEKQQCAGRRNVSASNLITSSDKLIFMKESHLGHSCLKDCMCSLASLTLIQPQFVVQSSKGTRTDERGGYSFLTSIPTSGTRGLVSCNTDKPKWSCSDCDCTACSLELEASDVHVAWQDKHWPCNLLCWW